MRHFPALRTTALLCLLFTFPVTALAQSDSPSARLIPLPAPAKGLSFGLHWDADILDTVDGGAKHGYGTDSVLSLGMGLNTGALGWWSGGTFSFGVQAITSTQPSAYAGALQAVSGIEAPNRRQVGALWYSQTFGDSALIRAGIMDINAFFDVNDTAGSLFVNSSFGIAPTIPSNVPTATYPDSAWGVMARIGAENDGWRLGVFQGDPANRSTALHRGAMAVAERDWHTAGGTRFGVGAWYRHAPAEAGPPESDWGAYANLEQPLPSDPDTAFFVQLGASPGEVNAVPAYLGAGVHFSNVSSVASDVGIAFARAWIRDHAAETSLEATVLFPFFDGALALQPDVQYIFHPSGIHPNALVIGLGLHAAFY